MSTQSKAQAEKWIKDGNPCVYRYGWAYRGATARPISKEKALELLPRYNFGKGFYILSFTPTKSGMVLEFNELSVLDME